MITPQLEVWTSKVGNDWTEKTRVSPSSRTAAFRAILQSLPVKTILEVGCNKGWNLEALSSLNGYNLYGVDPNQYAIDIGSFPPHAQVLMGSCFDIPLPDNSVDLVFTCGVMMHVTHDDLTKAVTELLRVTSKYLMLIEYYSTQEQEIPWHGLTNILWKRDYASSCAGLLLSGFLDRSQGFDNCNYWVFKK